MKIIRAIIFFFAIFLLVIGFVSLVEEIRRHEQVDIFILIGYSIGSFLPSVVFFAIGSIIHKRIKRKLAKSAYDNFLTADSNEKS